MINSPKIDVVLSANITVLSADCCNCYSVILNLTVRNPSDTPYGITNHVLMTQDLPGCVGEFSIAGPARIRCSGMCGYFKQGGFVLYAFGSISHSSRLDYICDFADAVPGNYTFKHETHIYPDFLLRGYPEAIVTTCNFYIDQAFVDVVRTKYPKSTEELERSDGFNRDVREFLSHFPKFTEHDAIDMGALLKQPLGNAFLAVDLPTPVSSKTVDMLILVHSSFKQSTDFLEKCYASIQADHELVDRFVANVISNPETPICSTSCAMNGEQLFTPEIYNLLLI